MADDEPVEEHPDDGEIMLDRRHGMRAAAMLDVRGEPPSPEVSAGELPFTECWSD